MSPALYYLEKLGGATGTIGDPSGKSCQRNILPVDLAASNLEAIKKQVNMIARNAFAKSKRSYIPSDPQLLILNNSDWYHEMTMLEFLASAGRNARVSSMLARESVRSRLTSEVGLSFTEFAYQLFQAWDWVHLLKHKSCTIQLGGSDQFGNIVAGIDMIDRVHKKDVITNIDNKNNTQQKEIQDQVKAYGITIPLLLKENGEKFGKSAEGAISLDARQLSPFDFWQTFINCSDTEVEMMLKRLTFLSLQEIDDIMDDHQVKYNSLL